MKKQNKKINLFKEILIQILPFICILCVFIITKNEYLIALLFLGILLLSFKIKYFKGEWGLFLLGCVLGIFLELGGDLIYKLQYWENGSFFGIPLWLPIIWGYGFVFMRRIGNFIVQEK